MKTNSRAKGRAGEQEAARMFRRWFPDCRRSFAQARIGYEQPDIIGGGIESEFFVEVKQYSKNTHVNFEEERRRWWDKLIADQVKHQKLMGDEHPSSLAIPILVYRITGYRPKRGWMVGIHRDSIPSLEPFCKYNLKKFVMVVSWSAFKEYMDETYT